MTTPPDIAAVAREVLALGEKAEGATARPWKIDRRFEGLAIRSDHPDPREQALVVYTLNSDNPNFDLIVSACNNVEALAREVIRLQTKVCETQDA